MSIEREYRQTLVRMDLLSDVLKMPRHPCEVCGDDLSDHEWADMDDEGNIVACSNDIPDWIDNPDTSEPPATYK